MKTPGRIRRSRARVADGVLFGRGAVDMKGGDRRLRRGHARSSRGAWRQAKGLDLVPDHRRRGKRCDQRHAEAARLGGQARRKVRPLHSGRAEQSRSARRHHQDRAERLAERHADRASASRATSPIPSAPTIRCTGLVTLDRGAEGRAARQGHRACSTPRIWNSSRSMSATRPST